MKHARFQYFKDFKRSLSSVVIVFSSIIMVLSAGWLFLHSRAQSRPIKTPFSHPFLKKAHAGNHPILFFRITSPLEEIPASGKSTSSNSSSFNFGLWIDLRLSSEGTLFVSPNELLAKGPATGKPIEMASNEECEGSGLFSLDQFRARIDEFPTVLNLISRRPGLAKGLLELWGEGKPISLNNTLIQSENEGTIKELRQDQARGLYGSSQATLVQIEILANFDLQGLQDLMSDVLVSDNTETRIDPQNHQTWKTLPRLRTATLKEAHRRGLRRYAGPADDVATAQSMLTDGYDGILTNSKDVIHFFFK